MVLAIPKKELKSEACEDINELGYSSILEKEIKGTCIWNSEQTLSVFEPKTLNHVTLEFNELKKEVKSGRDVEPKTINEKRRKLWDLMSVPRQKWALYYIKYRIGIYYVLCIDYCRGDSTEYALKWNPK